MSASKQKSKIKVPSFGHFLPEVIHELEKVSDIYLDSYNEHLAFVYMVAQLFETTNEENFVLTDGPKDGGIDFFIQASPSYSIYQCKCPNLETIQNREDSQARTPKYDQTPLEELLAAVEMLTDTQGEYDVKILIKRLRGDYQRDHLADSEGTNLTAALAVMGELTEPARLAFQSHRTRLAEKGISLRLIEWKKVYEALHALDAPEDVDVEFDVHVEDKQNDLLAHRDYCYVLAYAYDFYKAFRAHEWNLFDWNVRFQIFNSPINKRIIKSLKTRKGRKQFHHLNNGLLITCKGYSGMKRADNRLTVKGAQIINGCQTVRAICEAYEDLTPSEQEEFRRDARVQVKIIRTTDPVFIGELVISTNDQNPMKPRNLKSNSAEQRDIQNQFRMLPTKWFYQRKDGEWASLTTASSRVRWFRKSDYIVFRKGRGRRQFRRIDNQTLAKAWYAFTGHSHRALRGGIHYFEDESGGVYSRVFKSVPSPAFWSVFRQTTFVPSDEYFDQGIPSVYQYLLAYGIAEYIDSRKISSKASKKTTIQRGIKEGILKGDLEREKILSPPQEINTFLASDVEYNVNRMILYMREVLIELFSFVLSQKYVACDATNCQNLTSLPHLA